MGHPILWWIERWKSNRRSFDSVWPKNGPNLAQDDNPKKQTLRMTKSIASQRG